MWRKKQMVSSRDLQSCPHSSFSGRYLMEHKLHYIFHHIYSIPSMLYVCIKVYINNPLSNSPRTYIISTSSICLSGMFQPLFFPLDFYSMWQHPESMHLSPQPKLSRTLSVLGHLPFPGQQHGCVIHVCLTCVPDCTPDFANHLIAAS